MSARLPPTAEADNAATVPHRLGKYSLTGVLGEGTMGTVYKGIDPLIRRAVAVKAIRRQLLDPAAADYSAAQRFLNEARAAGKLSHPGIVGVYEYGEQDGQAFIAMEYVQGHSLGHCMARPERFAVADTLSVMGQLLEALHHAHEQGVWHRDVKPSNIIVTSDGRLKVTDFGIARIEAAELTQLTQLSQLIGSPGYIAPERYRGDAPDRRVDIFSCGVLLYHLLTGMSPFPGTDSEVMAKVLHKDPMPPSKTPGQPPPAQVWDGIVAKALAKRPADRYATAREFRDALLHACAGAMPATVSRAVTERAAPPISAPTTVTAARCVAPPGDSDPGEPTLAPAPSAPWDPAWLAHIERKLTRRVGPVAKVLVRRMTARCSGVPELLQRLAEEALPASDRQRFLDSIAPLARGDQVTRVAPLAPVVRLEPGAPVTHTVGAMLPCGSEAKPQGRYGSLPGQARNPPTLMVPLWRPTPLRPEMTVQAQRLLARHIGPIATLMVRNAASVATTRERFFAVLAELARDCTDRERLLRELSRLG